MPLFHVNQFDIPLLLNGSRWLFIFCLHSMFPPASPLGELSGSLLRKSETSEEGLQRPISRDWKFFSARAADISSSTVGKVGVFLPIPWCEEGAWRAKWADDHRFWWSQPCQMWHGQSWWITHYSLGSSHPSVRNRSNAAINYDANISTRVCMTASPRSFEGGYYHIWSQCHVLFLYLFEQILELYVLYIYMYICRLFNLSVMHYIMTNALVLKSVLIQSITDILHHNS